MVDVPTPSEPMPPAPAPPPGPPAPETPPTIEDPVLPGQQAPVRDPLPAA